MANDGFTFRTFAVQQDRCAMKVGTDGVLLGAWAGACCAGLPAPARIMDVGTGTGLIALMMAQTFPDARIEGIEIDHDAARQAGENAARSPYASRIAIAHIALADYHSPARFDLIVSNPPFYNATLKPSDAGRATARHNDALTWESLATFADSHLTERGVLALIFPTGEWAAVAAATATCGLAPVRICDVTTRQGKPAKRTLTLWMRRAQDIVRESLAIRYADGHYTEAYRQLTAPFYLHLG